MKLTPSAIENARYEGRSYLTKKGRKAWSKHIIWDDDFEGLGLRIFPTARKSFVLSYRDQGRKRMKTLGKFGPVTLDEARQQATEFLASIGHAPTSEGAPAANQDGDLTTFADLTQAYVDQQLKDRGSSAFAQQRLIRLHINPVLGNLPLSQIRPADLWRLRAQIAKRYPSDAGRLSNLVRLMFKWASDQGLWKTQPQGDASEDSSRAPEETGLEPRPQEAVDSAVVGEEDAGGGEIAPEPPLLAVGANTEETRESNDEKGEDVDELRTAREQLEMELSRANQELDGVRRHAAAEAQALRDKSADAENRISTLSLSVQQLQEALRDAESEHDRLTREVEEADERQRALTQEIHTLDSARRAQSVELDRVRAQLEPRQAEPLPRSEETAMATVLPRGRPTVPWLAGALVLGAILGGSLVSLLGSFGASSDVASRELQVATTGPSDAASRAEPMAAAGREPVEASVSVGPEDPGAEPTPTGTAPTEKPGPPDSSTSEPAASLALSEQEVAAGAGPEAPSALAAEMDPENREPAAGSRSVPDEDALEATVRAWAAAWTDQRVDDYLNSYSRSFIPADGMSRAEWEAQRRTRILRPEWIRLSLGPITPTVLEPGTIQADFDQAYATATYSDEVRKTIVLIWEDGAWKITEERSE